MTSGKQYIRLFALFVITLIAGCAVATTRPKMGGGTGAAQTTVQIINSRGQVIDNFITAVILGGDVTGSSASNLVTSLEGYPVSASTPAGNGYMLCSTGGKWAPCATPTGGPAPTAAPTSVAGLPTCNAGSIGLLASVTNMNCADVSFHATPVATATAGCQTNFYCYGNPSGAPTPNWAAY